MKKNIALMLVLAMLLSAAAVAGAEEVEWTFGLALKNINANVLDLVNSENPISPDYNPEDTVTVRTRKNDVNGVNTNGGIYMASNAKIVLRRIAANALVKMFNAAEIDGITLYVRAGYRTSKEQQKRYDRAVATNNLLYMQKAGECDYETGLAATVVSKEYRGATLDAGFASTPEARWLEQNCARFGFVLRYPEGKDLVTGNTYEPWHLRYVGPGVAAYMNKNNLCLEEFVAGFNQAMDEYVAAGGDLEEALNMGVLPAGPVELEEADSTGDHEITLFHD